MYEVSHSQTPPSHVNQFTRPQTPRDAYVVHPTERKKDKQPSEESRKRFWVLLARRPCVSQISGCELYAWSARVLLTEDETHGQHWDREALSQRLLRAESPGKHLLKAHGHHQTWHQQT